MYYSDNLSDYCDKLHADLSDYHIAHSQMKANEKILFEQLHLIEHASWQFRNQLRLLMNDSDRLYSISQEICKLLDFLRDNDSSLSAENLSESFLLEYLEKLNHSFNSITVDIYFIQNKLCNIKYLPVNPVLKLMSYITGKKRENKEVFHFLSDVCTCFVILQFDLEQIFNQAKLWIHDFYDTGFSEDWPDDWFDDLPAADGGGPEDEINPTGAHMGAAGDTQHEYIIGPADDKIPTDMPVHQSRPARNHPSISCPDDSEQGDSGAEYSWEDDSWEDSSWNGPAPSSNNGSNSPSIFSRDSDIKKDEIEHAAPDDVQFRAMAPQKIEKDTYALVKIMMYRDGDFERVEREKELFGKDITENTSSIHTVKKGTVFQIYLQSDDLYLTNECQEMVWNGIYASCDFDIFIPEWYSKKTLLLKARIYKNNNRFVDLRLVVRIAASEETTQFQYPEITPTLFKTMFVCFSVLDQEKVQASLFSIAATHSNPDMYIETYNNWEYTQKQIMERDLFLLYWSRNARCSVNVMQQLNYALYVKSADQIEPIPLESHFICEPPEKLIQKWPQQWRAIYFSRAERVPYPKYGDLSLEDEQYHCYRDALIKLITTNDCYGEKKEDILNDYMRNMISMRNNEFQDQHRQGFSESRKSAGELDFLYVKNGMQVSIGEALWIKETISSSSLKIHIDKLVDNYDPIGLPYGFLIIYVKKERYPNISNFWTEFINFMNHSYQYPHVITSKESIIDDENPGGANIRHAKQTIYRDKQREIIHFLAAIIP